MTTPLIILHRRNRIDQLNDVPPGCWAEIDVDLQGGVACVGHDSIAGQPIEHLDAYLQRALERGVTGFVFDCKREGIENSVIMILLNYEITNFFFLNEMEIRADMLLADFATHRTAMRVWQYRGAADVIRYVEALKTAKQNYPGWVWVDSWQRELPRDIGKAFIPLNEVEAKKLKQLGVKLCICSPELYVHDYERTYTPDELQAIYHGVSHYNRSLAQANIMPDAVCTKFPKLWNPDID